MRNKFEYFKNILRYFFRYILRPRALLSRKRFLNYLTYSQAGQDIFVSLMHGSKKSGTFVEIGSQDPIKNNNTFLLESELDWRGFLLEIRDDFSLYCRLRRSNPCYKADATAVNYNQLFSQNNLPLQIDYLQIDIDPAAASLLALKAMPHDRYRFSLITFEHDNYQGDSSVMMESRVFLENLGYCAIAKNVRFNGDDFEDWWIDPCYFGFMGHIENLKFDNLEWQEVLRKLKEKIA